MTASTEVAAEVREAATRAKRAARQLKNLTRAQKDLALKAMADALVADTATIVSANSLDVEAARANGTSAAIVDRLTLTPQRLADIADALRSVADLPDPVGTVVRGWVQPNGLEIRQVRVPLGVVGMIYEARPNVTVDAAGLCLKSGNVALLRGSSSALHSNQALVDSLRRALEAVGITPDAVVLVPGTSHASVSEMLTARGLIDVLIPRGGAGLIRNVVDNATVPVIETGVGNVHVYLDAGADAAKAVSLVVNSKAQRVSVCNAAETLLVHAEAVDTVLPAVLEGLRQAGVTIHGDERMAKAAAEAGIDFVPATDEDWAAEYYSLDLAAAVVDSLEDALDHILTWSSGHTEAIITESQTAARAFVAGVDSAAVMVNASTRFTDGGEFGFGAEIGISTQKLHARGPMGLAELTSTTYIVTGDGQIRG